MIRAVVFDAFGTLITYGGGRINPYRHLFRTGAKRLPLLTRNVGLATFADEAGVAHLVPLMRQELAQEIDALQLFEDVETTLSRLRDEGMKIAVCSNLATEYGPVVRRLLPRMDAYVFSYEVGAKKPDPAIYAEASASLGCGLEEILFIGDSRRADFDGPRAFGMQARLLDRKAGQTLVDALPAMLRR